LSNLYVGSSQWANQVLRIAIHEINNVSRDLHARRLEVHYWLSELVDYGFKWHESRLRNHVNLAIKKGRFSFASPSLAGSSSSTTSKEVDSPKRGERAGPRRRSRLVELRRKSNFMEGFP
jgi:hypothetical protein